MIVRAWFDTAKSYRVFAGRGNTLSNDGVTVIVSVPSVGDIEFQFWSSSDAELFFRNLAEAAANPTSVEAGEQGSMIGKYALTGEPDVGSVA